MFKKFDGESESDLELGNHAAGKQEENYVLQWHYFEVLPAVISIIGLQYSQGLEFSEILPMFAELTNLQQISEPTPAIFFDDEKLKNELAVVDP